MEKTIYQFKFFGMPVDVSRQAQLIAFALIILCTALAVIFTRLTPLDSLIAGILAMLLHSLSYLLHHYGRFQAQKQRGEKTMKVNLRLLPDPKQFQVKKGNLQSRLHPRNADAGIVTTILILITCLQLWFFVRNYSPMTTFLISWMLFVQVFILLSAILMSILSSIKIRKK